MLRSSTPYEVAELYIQDHILYCIYKEDTDLTMPGAQWVLEKRLFLQRYKPMPVYCDITGIINVSKEVRDYMAMEGVSAIIALALLVRNPVSKVISNVFIHSSEPPIPTSIFTQHEPALSYLKDFLR